MPLYYRKNNTTYAIYYYDTLSELNGPGVSSSHYLAVRVSGTIKYIGLTTNLSHTHVSDMRVRIDNTTYGVMVRSKYETQSITKSSPGNSSTLVIPGNAYDISSDFNIVGASSGAQGGGGGGGSSFAFLNMTRSPGVLTAAQRSGAGGSSGGPKNSGSTTNCSGITLLAGGQYRLKIGSAGNGSNGGGGGLGFCISKICGVYSGCVSTMLFMNLYGGGKKASGSSSGGSSYLQCYTGSSWSSMYSASGGAGGNYTNYRDGGGVGCYYTCDGVCGCAISGGGDGGKGRYRGGVSSGKAGGTCGSTILLGTSYGGSGNTSGPNGGKGGNVKLDISGTNPTAGSYYQNGTSGQSGGNGSGGSGCINVCYWLNGN